MTISDLYKTIVRVRRERNKRQLRLLPGRSAGWRAKPRNPTAAKPSLSHSHPSLSLQSFSHFKAKGHLSYRSSISSIVRVYSVSLTLTTIDAIRWTERLNYRVDAIGQHVKPCDWLDEHIARLPCLQSWVGRKH